MLTNFADFATEHRMFLSAIYEHRGDSLFSANYRGSNLSTACLSLWGTAAKVRLQFVDTASRLSRSTIVNFS